MNFSIMFERMRLAFVHHYYVTVVLAVFSWTSDYHFILTIHASPRTSTKYDLTYARLRRIPSVMS